uniref:Uncharacterized protein n=1 Tax=Ditylum brightwellii TaxID=49249 RepID=A0A7S4WC75_9STRA
MTSLPDHLKPLSFAMKSHEPSSVQEALSALYSNQYSLQEVNFRSRQTQDAWLNAALLLQGSAKKSALGAHSSIISERDTVSGGISTMIPTNFGGSNTFNKDDALEMSNTLLPFGSIPFQHTSSSASENTRGPYDFSVLSQRSDFEDSYHVVTSAQRRKRRLEEFSDHEISTQKKMRRPEGFESDSIADKSSGVSHISHESILVALPEDINFLTESRCVIRRQIEFFRATKEDVNAMRNGRSRLPQVGQVGIRCIHCKHLFHQDRPTRATVFPSSLDQVYTAVKNWQHFHVGACTEIPQDFRERIAASSGKRKRANGSGSAYWADAAKKLGVAEYKHGLCFEKDLGAFEDTIPFNFTSI